MPGGCIFFILAGKIESASDDLHGFLQSVRWMLAEAASRESHSAFEAVAARREFSAAMIHGVVNAIRAIRTKRLIDMLFRAFAPRDALMPEHLAIEFHGIPPEDTKLKQHFIDIIYGMILAEDTAASLAGMGELHADGGIIRPKYQSKQSIRIRKLVREAIHLALVNLKLQRNAQIRNSSLDELLYDWELPRGYLQTPMITGVMMELFINALKYQQLTRKSTIYVGIFEREENLVVQVANDLRPCDGGYAPGIGGFLSRSRLLFEDIKGITLTHSPAWMERCSWRSFGLEPWNVQADRMIAHSL